MAANVKSRVLAELSNAVPKENDKVKRKPLATITVPAAAIKTDKVDNDNVKLDNQKAKGEVKKVKAPLSEKENENVENPPKAKVDKTVIVDKVEPKSKEEAKEDVKVEIKEDVKVEVKEDVKVEVKVEVKVAEKKPEPSSEIIESNDKENENPTPCSGDGTSLEDISLTESETFEPHEDDWCFSKMLFLRSLEYEEEIQKYLLRLQVKNRADPDYMTKHKPEINDKMRTILIDWMVEVVEEYKMTSETLFLAVNFIDRFLSVLGIARAKFQLLGTTALFISSKYEEIYPPDVHEFVYITDNAYDKWDILSMESKVLKALDFNISTPTVIYFLRKHLATIGLGFDLPQTVGIMAEYLCYISLLECNPSVSYLSNDIAVAAIILSASLFGIKLKLSGVTGRTFFPGFTDEQLKAHVVELQSCVDTLHHLRKSVKIENDALFKAGKPQQAVFNKFAQEKYFSVSLLEIGSQEAPKLVL